MFARIFGRLNSGASTAPAETHTVRIFYAGWREESPSSGILFVELEESMSRSFDDGAKDEGKQKGINKPRKETDNHVSHGDNAITDSADEDLGPDFDDLSNVPAFTPAYPTARFKFHRRSANGHSGQDDTATVKITEEDMCAVTDSGLSVPAVSSADPPPPPSRSNRTMPRLSPPHPAYFHSSQSYSNYMSAICQRKAVQDRLYYSPPRVYGLCTEQTRLNGVYCNECRETFWIKFTSLPRELRELVYGAIFAKKPSFIVLSPYHLDTHLPFPAILPPICYVNKQVCNESIPTLLRSKYIRFKGSAGSAVLTKLLEKVPRHEAYKALTHVGVEGGQAIGGQLQEGTDLTRILTLGTGLRSLQIQINAFDFLTFKSYRWQKKPREDVMSKFRGLARVLELPRLHVLAIHCCGGRAYMKDVGCSEDAIFEHLISWIKDEMLDCGKGLELRVTYSDPDWGPQFYNVARYPYRSEMYMGWGQGGRTV